MRSEWVAGTLGILIGALLGFQTGRWWQATIHAWTAHTTAWRTLKTRHRNAWATTFAGITRAIGVLVILTVVVMVLADLSS